MPLFTGDAPFTETLGSPVWAGIYSGRSPLPSVSGPTHRIAEDSPLLQTAAVGAGAVG
jgi:hypothetical protein